MIMVEYANFEHYAEKVIVKSGDIAVTKGEGEPMALRVFEPGKSREFCEGIAEQELNWRSQAKIVHE